MIINSISIAQPGKTNCYPRKKNLQTRPQIQSQTPTFKGPAGSAMCGTVVGAGLGLLTGALFPILFLGSAGTVIGGLLGSSGDKKNDDD